MRQGNFTIPFSIIQIPPSNLDPVRERKKNILDFIKQKKDLNLSLKRWARLEKSCPILTGIKERQKIRVLKAGFLWKEK